jgi:hypothetical protein
MEREAMSVDSVHFKYWEDEHLKNKSINREIWDAAKRIACRRSSYIGAGGTMYLNITEVVAQGIELGIAMGRQAERNEILESVALRDKPIN